VEVAIDATTWPKDGVDLAWINSPSNPTGRVHSDTELRAVIDWSKEVGAVVASDECYLSFPDSKQGRSILSLTSGDNRNILAIHSLSKRSNMAGYRGSFIAGDASLVAKLLEVRKHMGMMAPLPIQKAVTVALSDESHVREQALRYKNRRKILSEVLQSLGFTIEFSEAGLYIWCTRGEMDWDTVQWFAERGVLVTPGRFYGDKGARHVRIALTATDEKIAEVTSRLAR
jgi:aspartate/methionine/tyrosine aminotransferase